MHLLGIAFKQVKICDLYKFVFLFPLFTLDHKHFIISLRIFSKQNFNGSLLFILIKASQAAHTPTPCQHFAYLVFRHCPCVEANIFVCESLSPAVFIFCVYSGQFPRIGVTRWKGVQGLLPTSRQIAFWNGRVTCGHQRVSMLQSAWQEFQKLTSLVECASLVILSIFRSLVNLNIFPQLFWAFLCRLLLVHSLPPRDLWSLNFVLSHRYEPYICQDNIPLFYLWKSFAPLYLVLLHQVNRSWLWSFGGWQFALWPPLYDGFKRSYWFSGSFPPLFLVKDGSNNLQVLYMSKLKPEEIYFFRSSEILNSISLIVIGLFNH